MDQKVSYARHRDKGNATPNYLPGLPELAKRHTVQRGKRPLKHNGLSNWRAILLYPRMGLEAVCPSPHPDSDDSARKSAENDDFLQRARADEAGRVAG